MHGRCAVSELARVFCNKISIEFDRSSTHATGQKAIELFNSILVVQLGGIPVQGLRREARVE